MAHIARALLSSGQAGHATESATPLPQRPACLCGMV